MTTAALIVAAGRGTRADGEVPKQWRVIAGKPILQHTINAFNSVAQVQIIAAVLHADDMGRAKDLVAPGLIVATGAADRAGSVQSGLTALADHGVERVLVHDAARPCVPTKVIRDVLKALDTGPAAAPALAVTDALWTGDEGSVTGTQDRTGLFRAQTPQGFHFDAIREAHDAHPSGAADDVEVARAYGLPVTIVPGDEDGYPPRQRV